MYYELHILKDARLVVCSYSLVRIDLYSDILITTMTQRVLKILTCVFSDKHDVLCGKKLIIRYKNTNGYLNLII